MYVGDYRGCDVVGAWESVLLSHIWGRITITESSVCCLATLASCWCSSFCKFTGSTATLLIKPVVAFVQKEETFRHSEAAPTVNEMPQSMSR